MTETVLSLERTADAPREARGRVRNLSHVIGPDRVDDATLLVSELVTNAVKYGPEHEAIKLIVRSDGDRTRFTVHDLGLGPLPEMRDADDPSSGRPRPPARRRGRRPLGRRARQHPRLVRARPLR